jgi:Rieske Fe-S protein
MQMELNRRQLVIATVAAAACGCLCDAAEVFAGPTTSPAKGAGASTGGIDVGEIKDYPGDGAFEKYAKNDKIMVIRSGDKIYATSAICTHKRCTLNGKPTEMSCRCHNSHFSLAGDPKGGPARQPLARYAIALRDGHIFVDPKKTIAKAKYDDEGSFVSVK